MLSEQPINILLVDDRPENLLALEALLQPLGYRLIKARSGQEALRCVLQYDFAVILLDVQMPNIDGFETAELIRGRERSRSTPIIFLTAVSTSELHIAKGYLAGAVDYLLKPFVPEILLSKVAIFVDLYAKTAEVRQQAKQLEATVGTLEHEIAERERVEADLRQARDGLEQRVRERTIGLARGQPGAANRDRRAQAPGGAAHPIAENGEHRPAGRRYRARFQQLADGDLRLCRAGRRWPASRSHCAR